MTISSLTAPPEFRRGFFSLVDSAPRAWELPSDMSEMPKISVRDFDPPLWREFKAECARRGHSMGEALMEAVRQWLGRSS